MRRGTISDLVTKDEKKSCGGNDVFDYAGKMKSRTRHHKNMPEGVVVPESTPGVEEDGN